MLERRTILRGLVAAPFGGIAADQRGRNLRPLVASAPDPIFAAIEKHKVAYAALETAVAVDDGNGPDVDWTSDAEQEARYDMHETVPKTHAGLAAYVAYWTHHTGVPANGGAGTLESIGWEAIPTIAEAMEALFPAAGKGGAA